MSSLSHLAGAVLALLMAVPLLRRAIKTRRELATGIFVAGVVCMFVMSGMYHLLPTGPGRAFFQRMDHAAIFFLIAATFTPVLSEHFDGVLRVVLLAAIWTCGVAGIILKVVFFESASETVGLILYLAMGWSGLAVGLMALRRAGVRRLVPMAAGGLLYTLGALLDFFRWPVLWNGVVGGHELFHACVMAAVATHWWYVNHNAGSPALSPAGPARA